MIKAAECSGQWRLWSDLRPSIKIKLFAVPLPTFDPYPKLFFGTFGKYNFFFYPIFIRKSQFSHYAALKQETITITYLPNLNIQGRGVQQTNNFLRMAWVFAGWTGHFVGFVMLRFNFVTAVNIKLTWMLFQPSSLQCSLNFSITCCGNSVLEI